MRHLFALCPMLMCNLIFGQQVDRATPPNVVFIIGDDQGARDYGFLNHPHIKTPHLDKFASECLAFHCGTVPTSLCRASLATMITGLFPHQHLITSNDPPLPAGKTLGNASSNNDWQKQRAEMVSLFERSPNLAKLLGERGYISMQAGKWWEGNACRCGGFSEGMTHGDIRRGGRHGDEGLTIGRQGLTKVLAFVDDAHKQKKPFYLWYAPMMPHQPHNPPDRLINKYKSRHPSLHVAKYWAMCEWFDETVGELLQHLDKQGLRDNTIVVYLHDNGWIQSEDKPQYAARSKRSPYQTGVQTPILIRWPGHVKPEVIQQPVSSVDLVPTILLACGLTPTSSMQGINLLDRQAVQKRSTVYGEIFEHNAVDIHSPAQNLQYRWMLQGQWKLIVPNLARVPNQTVELYDLNADPLESKNLATLHPEKVKTLQQELDNWWNGK
jgi:arylsulfatase A-like enzyme